MCWLVFLITISCDVLLAAMMAAHSEPCVPGSGSNNETTCVECSQAIIAHSGTLIYTASWWRPGINWVIIQVGLTMFYCVHTCDVMCEDPSLSCDNIHHSTLILSLSDVTIQTTDLTWTICFTGRRDTNSISLMDKINIFYVQTLKCDISDQVGSHRSALTETD